MNLQRQLFQRLSPQHRHGVAWLEVLLALAIIALVLQLFPALGRSVLWAVDIRNWSNWGWFTFFGLVCLMLSAMQYGPGLVADWQQRQRDRAAERQELARQQEAREQRKSLERMQQARRRRMY